jgi:hypothetical protein
MFKAVRQRPPLQEAQLGAFSPRHDGQKYHPQYFSRRNFDATLSI